MHAELEADSDEDEAEDALVAEMGTLAELDHPNIVKMFGIMPSAPEDGDRKGYMLLLELCDMDLSNLIHKMKMHSSDAGWRGARGVHLSLRLAEQIASGLAYLHSDEVAELIGHGKNMHLDMKPGNVLLKKMSVRETSGCGYTVRLADFG